MCAGWKDGGGDGNMETEENKQTDRNACSQKLLVGGGEGSDSMVGGVVVLFPCYCAAFA